VKIYVNTKPGTIPGESLKAWRGFFAVWAKNPLSIMQCFEILVWLGRQDSNLRITESKSVALPLGYSPSDNLIMDVIRLSYALCFNPRLYDRMKVEISEI
jgi:hypothetical protein